MEQRKTISIREADGSIIKLEEHGGLASTAALAREYANCGYPDRYVVFSDKKIIHKGTDKSDEDILIENGMYMSIILRPSLFPSQATFLGALSATALVSALEEHTTKKLGLGWVSDVYCNGVRIGKAVVEGKLDSFTAYEYIIVTFEAKLDEENFPPRLTDMIKKVFESDNSSISMIIAKNVLKRFFKLYPKIKAPERFMDIYSQKFVLRGTKIKYTSEQRKLSCKVLGVNKKTGALIVETSSGRLIDITSQKQVSIPKKIRMPKANSEDKSS